MTAAGRFWTSYLAVVLLLLSWSVSPAHALGGMVYFNNMAGGSVSDNSCAAVGAAAVKNNGSSSVAYADCSSDPVVAGTSLILRTSTGAGYSSTSVTAIYATAAASGVDWQPTISALDARITALESAVSGLPSGTALTPIEYQELHDLLVQSQSPYDYANGGAIFAAIFIANISLYFLARGGMEVVRAVRAARRV